MYMYAFLLLATAEADWKSTKLGERARVTLARFISHSMHSVNSPIFFHSLAY